MTAVEILKTQIADGGLGAGFRRCKAVDIGDGFALATAKHCVALCSEDAGGTLLIPWVVMVRLAQEVQEGRR